MGFAAINKIRNSTYLQSRFKHSSRLNIVHPIVV
jgi:hypothetical protein